MYRGRSMVGHNSLEVVIGVRIPASVVRSGEGAEYTRHNTAAM